jgi:tRNA-dihydrouridine synthase 4
MVMADSFIHSKMARDMEFQLCTADEPVVLQFAARNAYEFANAAEIAAPFVDGIDLNCGCPQRWALQEGIGAKLMHVDPEHLRDMIQQARNRSVNTPISVKIRIYEDRRRTVDLAQMLEAAGAAWITVHGRRKDQRPSEPIDPVSIRLVKESLGIPVIANGNVFTLDDAETLYQQTGVNGIMSARGLLENPALFSGHRTTPWQAVEKYIDLAVQYGTCHAILHHHLVTMLEKVLSPSASRHFNTLASIPAIIDFIDRIKDCSE